MYSTQKIGTFAVVEARNAPCPMEWGCPKDRSMTVFILVRTGRASGWARHRVESCESENGEVTPETEHTYELGTFLRWRCTQVYTINAHGLTMCMGAPATYRYIP